MIRIDQASAVDEETSALAAALAKEDDVTLEAPYWDGVFNGATEPTEWLLSYGSAGRFFIEALCSNVTPLLPSALKVITIGSGNSSFGPELHTALDERTGSEPFYAPGGKMVCSDFSSTVIDAMKVSQGVGRAALEWSVEDARRLSYADGSCLAVVDKSLIDCLFYAASHADAVRDVFAEACRVLAPGGVALFLTQRGPDELEPYLLPAGAWQSCEFVPLAAQCDDDGNVVPGCKVVVDDDIDEAFGAHAQEGDDYEIILLYICVKRTLAEEAVAAKRTDVGYEIERVDDIERYRPAVVAEDCVVTQCSTWDCAAWCRCYVPDTQYACAKSLAAVAECRCTDMPSAPAPAAVHAAGALGGARTRAEAARLHAHSQHAAAALQPLSDVGRCLLVNAPGAAQSGGPRCLDHFGMRFPLRTGLRALAEKDATINPWPCALWAISEVESLSVDDAPMHAIRSGRFGRLCLTRVAATWGSTDASLPTTEGTALDGATAVKCGTPLLETQKWRVAPALLAPGSAAPGSITAVRGGPAACLRAHVDPCRPWVATAGELAPCSAAAPLQQWLCVPPPATSAATTAHPLLQPSVVAAMLVNSAIRAVLAECAVRRALVQDAIAEEQRGSALGLMRADSDVAIPRLFVNDASRLCLQPMRRRDASIVIVTHRCSGIGYALDAADAPPPGGGAAAATAPTTPTRIAAVVWKVHALSAAPGGVRGAAGLEGATNVNEVLVAMLQLAHAGHAAAARCLSWELSGEQPSGISATLATCDAGSAEQHWRLDIGVLGSRTLRPRGHHGWCLTADEDVANGWEHRVTLQRCECTEPRQKWGARRMERVAHALGATATEAHATRVALDSTGEYWAGWRRNNAFAVSALNYLGAADALTAKSVPPRWLAFRSLEDVYEPVPVGYLEWLARAARSASSSAAKAHLALYEVTKMYANTTAPLTNIFSIALYVPAPVTPQLVPLFGPRTERDDEYAERYAAVVALTSSRSANAAREFRASEFYQQNVAPLLDALRLIARELPEWGTRVYIAPELMPIVPDILAAGSAQVAVMRTRSIRNSGAFWRWIAFDDATLQHVCACDIEEMVSKAGRTVVSTMWNAVEAWKAPGPRAGAAFFRWFPGWTRLVRASNSRGVQYAPIQASIVLCKPQLVTWSIVDSIVGFGLARVLRPHERRVHPHGSLDAHMFSRAFDSDAAHASAQSAGARVVYPSLGWGRRFNENGFEEAWAKHVLYYRAVAENALHSVIPRRVFEAESPSDLVVVGPLRSDANAARRCANPWFLDAVHQSRFTDAAGHNAIVETATSGVCSPYTDEGALFVAPCGTSETGTSGQRWARPTALPLASYDLRPTSLGDRMMCVTVPSESELRTLRTKERPAVALMRECGGRAGENDAHEQVFALNWASAQTGGYLMLDARRAEGAVPMCLDARGAGSGEGGGAQHVVVSPCADPPPAGQHWRYRAGMGVFYTMSTGAAPHPLCLARPACVVERVAAHSLRGMCDSSAHEAHARSAAVAGSTAAPLPLGPQGADRAKFMERVSAAEQSDASFAAVAGPHPGPGTDGSVQETLASALASFDALRSWFVQTGVHGVEVMRATPFHQGRNAFFTEITDGVHGGLARPWTDEASSYFSQVPIQTLVAMLGTIECARAQCGADVAENLARLGVGYPNDNIARTPVNDAIVRNLHLARWAEAGQMMQIMNDARNGAIAHINEKRAEIPELSADVGSFSKIGDILNAIARSRNLDVFLPQDETTPSLSIDDVLAKEVEEENVKENSDEEEEEEEAKDEEEEPRTVRRRKRRRKRRRQRRTRKKRKQRKA